MIQTLAPRAGGVPISATACMCCVGKEAGWNSFYSRPRTMCAAHYMEWVEEKTYGEDY